MNCFDEADNHNDAFLTHYTEDVKHTIDYVWYSSSKYTVGGVLQAPDLNFLESNSIGCPFGPFASDHFSLLIDFVKKDN